MADQPDSLVCRSVAAWVPFVLLWLGTIAFVAWVDVHLSPNIIATLFMTIVLAGIFGLLLMMAFLLALNWSRHAISGLLVLTSVWSLTVTVIFLLQKNWVMAILLAKVLVIVVILVILSFDQFTYTSHILRVASRFVNSHRVSFGLVCTSVHAYIFFLMAVLSVCV